MKIEINKNIAIILLIILVAIGGIVLFGSEKNPEQNLNFLNFFNQK